MADTFETYADEFSFPRTDLTRSTADYAARLQPDWLLNHSIRAYVFGRQVGVERGLAPGTDYDDELLFIGCVLHDLGLTPDGDGPHRFEVDGANLAADFLAGQGVDPERIGVVWDGIALHTSYELTERRPEARLLQSGTTLDIIGPRDQLSAGLVERTLAAFPRKDSTRLLGDAIIDQALRNPAKGAPTTFAGELLRQRHPDRALPTWDQLVAASGWAD